VNLKRNSAKINEKIDPKKGTKAIKEFLPTATKIDWNAADGAIRVIEQAKSMSTLTWPDSSRKKLLSSSEKIKIIGIDIIKIIKGETIVKPNCAFDSGD
jgi:hypothetical protein